MTKLIETVSAFQMWIYRRFLRIAYKGHLTNEEVLRRIRQQQEITFMITTHSLGQGR